MSQLKYPKIETVFSRDDSIPGRPVKVDELRCPEFALVKHWTLTEKIDGTNIRIILSADGSVCYAGRTDEAQIPKPLLAELERRFPSSVVAPAFDPGTNAVLFGEGYGAGIQKGGSYSPVPSFRLFDVAVIGGRLWWLELDSVNDIAEKIGCETAPVVARGATVFDAVSVLKNRLPSQVSAMEGTPRECEGVVARTEPLLLMRNGERVIWKLKIRDFVGGGV